MKILTYYLSDILDIGTQETPELVTVQGALCTRRCTDAEYPEKYAASIAEAYNGEVTVEDIGPDMPSKFTLPLHPDCTGTATYSGLGDAVTIEADVTTTYHIGTLPYGFRPTADRKIQATCPGGLGVIVIVRTDGVVHLETPQALHIRVILMALIQARVGNEQKL